jgi:uncharacterized membrane protein
MTLLPILPPPHGDLAERLGSEYNARLKALLAAAWCGFFVLDGGACGFFALFTPRETWAPYTGLLSYLILGLLFAVEVTLRKYLFRRIGAGLLDRFFSWIFPPRPEAKAVAE